MRRASLTWEELRLKYQILFCKYSNNATDFLWILIYYRLKQKIYDSFKKQISNKCDLNTLKKYSILKNLKNILKMELQRKGERET